MIKNKIKNVKSAILLSRPSRVNLEGNIHKLKNN